eukprot:171772-Chlamydomonas_euryale.AAC.1
MALALGACVHACKGTHAQVWMPKIDSPKSMNALAMAACAPKMWATRVWRPLCTKPEGGALTHTVTVTVALAFPH